MVQNPWLSGCYELLDHGIGHFLEDTEFDRKLAMISIDNAFMVKNNEKKNERFKLIEKEERKYNYRKYEKK